VVPIHLSDSSSIAQAMTTKMSLKLLTSRNDSSSTATAW